MADVAKYLMGESPNIRKIYLIRHGATALNSEDGGDDRIRGWKDVPLSKEGQDQAQSVAKSLKNSGLDVLYSSTLSRATDTANAIADQTGAKIVPTDALKPWDLGKYTGQHSKDAHPEIVGHVEKTPDIPVEGGESFNSFKMRAFQGLKQAVMDPSPRVGIVTHHRVERLLKAWIKEGQPADLSIDNKEMLKRGERTGHAEVLHIEPHKLGIIPANDRPNIARILLNKNK